MSDGKVKWFNPRKGYGFIDAGDGRDIFVHYASISSEGYKTLAEGDEVSFDIVEGEKGLRAENVVAKSAPRSQEATAVEKEAVSKSETTSEVEAPLEDETASESEASSESEVSSESEASSEKE